MHTKLTHSLFAACSIGLAMFSFKANAATATQFVYSPLFCQTFGGALWIYPSGQIANRGTETMRVFCPLIHEAKTDHSQKLQISIVNANRQDKVRCRARYNHPHALEWESDGWNGQNDLGIQTATITLSGNRYLGGSHMIECEIPRKDHNQPNFDGESRMGTYKSGVD